MWNDLPSVQKDAYKRLILAFASLTEMFAQKSSENDNTELVPIINSKFQETAFQKSFKAYAEDIGNTSYDVSLEHNGVKYLVGIKTFGIASGDQKVAQFKAKHDDWAEIIDEIKTNANGVTDKQVINSLNKDLYLKLAKGIAELRNARIESSCANTRGFKVEAGDEDLCSVYHVLMPSSKNEKAKIYVGETSYDKIDIEKLSIIGCTSPNNPTNFLFSDGNHVYKYTSADSQLHMNFKNKDIVCDEWDVKYADDAHDIFEKIADMVYPRQSGAKVNEEDNDSINAENYSDRIVEETYCWTIWNKNKEVEMFSGFNSFFGTGSKIGKEQRKQRIDKICDENIEQVDNKLLNKLKAGMSEYLLDSATSSDEKEQKVVLRSYLSELLTKSGTPELKRHAYKLLYRPMDEMYIPIPDSAKFHKEHPDFFGPGFGRLKTGTNKLELPKEKRRFNLVFEPSGDVLPAYITQDNGKAIESVEKQSYLGEWILRGIFQLKEYEPLTSKRLIELNINGLRFTKYKGSNDIHVEFIWIDEDNPPTGFIPRK
ncbi:NgoFVII family restriction endonuclease [Catonella massiliensis]|jgi:hypothetical protein|uniref:NgoFVII family restriction endonuclease n=1 Tax=Catonella massiliensis TaxID=2799636 RepID=A0ABS1J4T5_9FIRM|nr:NgoFVII family restriction endonuclease [Catonella massiliensis]MBK5898553.1 NgoFVII family restriction endonuclease [Catonella massiliensis]